MQLLPATDQATAGRALSVPGRRAALRYILAGPNRVGPCPSDRHYREPPRRVMPRWAPNGEFCRRPRLFGRAVFALNSSTCSGSTTSTQPCSPLLSIQHEVDGFLAVIRNDRPRPGMSRGPRRQGPRNHPHEIGGCRRGVCTIPAGALARRAAPGARCSEGPAPPLGRSPPRPTTSSPCIGACPRRCARPRRSICEGSDHQLGPASRPQLGPASRPQGVFRPH